MYQSSSPTLLKNNNVDKRLPVKRFLKLFFIFPAFENRRSAGTDVATTDKYFTAIGYNVGKICLDLSQYSIGSADV